MKSKGLGDSIEKITRATGIEWFVKQFVGDCGCEDRKAWLNAKFPYKGDLTPEEIAELDVIFDRKKSELNPKEAATVFRIYNRIWGKRHRPKRCQSCNKEVIRQIIALYAKSK